MKKPPYPRSKNVAASATHYVAGAHQNALELGGGKDSDWRDDFRCELARALVEQGNQERDVSASPSSRTLRDDDRLGDIVYVDADSIYNKKTSVWMASARALATHYYAYATVRDAAGKIGTYECEGTADDNSMINAVLNA